MLGGDGLSCGQRQKSRTLFTPRREHACGNPSRAQLTCQWHNHSYRVDSYRGVFAATPAAEHETWEHSAWLFLTASPLTRVVLHLGRCSYWLRSASRSLINAEQWVMLNVADCYHSYNVSHKGQMDFLQHHTDPFDCSLVANGCQLWSRTLKRMTTRKRIEMLQQSTILFDS